jgi:hypothetical protein
VSTPNDASGAHRLLRFSAVKHRTMNTLGVYSGLIVFAFSAELRADSTNVEEQLRVLQQQNETFQSQMRKQQELIDSLSREVENMRQSAKDRDAEAERMKADEQPAASAFKPGKVQITGEGAVGFFKTGSQGVFPNDEFRVDEARLFFDAPVWGNAYFFAEVNLATREASDVDLHLGELYLDVEDVSQLWGCDRQLNLRAGRMDIPFGEEYLYRDAIDNPLISHSLSDIWGIDEGVELYGSFGQVSYVVAGQNGGHPPAHDFDSDKSVAGRISYDPLHWLHLSVSGMRTGDLDVQGDRLSEVWFGNGWIRSLGSPATTKFHANIFEGDVAVHWTGGHVRAWGGVLRYDDNDPAADNSRNVYYYAVEGVQDIYRKLYGAARFSQILAKDGGFTIVGDGTMSEYLFSGTLTEDLWRLSLGLGYRWNRNLVLKTEYSFEDGKTTAGESRDHENLFAVQAAFGF